MQNTRTISLIPAPRTIAVAFLIASLALTQLPRLANVAHAAIGQVFLPNVTKTLGGNAGWTTPIIVQNTGPVPTDVTLSFYRFSDGSAVASEKSPMLNPGQSWSFDPRIDPKLPDDAQYSAVLQATSGQVAAIVLEGSGSSWMSYSGTPTGGATVFLPNVTRRLGGRGGWDTPFIVQNLGTQPTTATVSFYNFADGSLAKKIEKVSLQPGRAQAFLPWTIDGLLDDRQYSVVIQGPQGSQLYAVVNESSGAQAMSYEGLLAGSAVVYLPNVLKYLGGRDHWSTPFIVQNLGAQATTFALEFFSFDTGQLMTKVEGIALEPGRSYPVDVRFFPGSLPAGSYSVVVRGAQGAQLGAVVNEVELSAGMAMSYGGITQGQQTAYLPIVQKTAGSASWVSPIIAQNLAAIPADITVTLFDQKGATASQRVFKGVAVGAAAVYDPRADRRLATGTYSALVQSAGAVSAVVNLTGALAGDYAMAYTSASGALVQIPSRANPTPVIGGVTFSLVQAATSDIYVEMAIPQADAAKIAKLADVDAAQVEADFGRQFAQIPKIYVFSGKTQLAQGLQTLVGYSPVEAKLTSELVAALYSPKANAVFVNWATVSKGQPLGAIRHELTHLMIHSIIGGNPTLPAWFDEGTALIEEETAPGSAWLSMVSRFGTASMANSNTLFTLDSLSSPILWATRFGDDSQYQYFQAEQTVRAMRADLGQAGTVKILDLMAGGATFEAAYAAVAGRPLAEFAASLPARMKALASSYPGIATAQDSYIGAGLTIMFYGFTPDTIIQTEILGSTGGNSRPILVTRFGSEFLYLGTTWPAGSYSVKATGPNGTVNVVAVKAP